MVFIHTYIHTSADLLPSWSVFDSLHSLHVSQLKALKDKQKAAQVLQIHSKLNQIILLLLIEYCVVVLYPYMYTCMHIHECTCTLCGNIRIKRRW